MGQSTITLYVASGKTLSRASNDKVWANPTRINANDTSYATSDTDVNAGIINQYAFQTEWLVTCQNDGGSLINNFNIPSNATINGIQVALKLMSARSDSHYDGGAFLTKDGINTVGSDYKIATVIGSTVAYHFYGGATDLWGTTWTPSEINANNFGFMYWCNNLNASHAPQILVDFAYITISYTTVSTKYFLPFFK